MGKNYETEARSRWGNTDAYKQHQEKTKDYSKEKWNALTEGMDQVMAAFAQCMTKGENANSAEAQSLVSQLQNFITEHSYTCTKEILAGLGQMYVMDDRFKENIDTNGAGTAQFASDAIAHYCRQ